MSNDIPTSSDVRAADNLLRHERALRQTFHERVLKASFDKPRELLNQLCRHWLDATEADAVILWLFNHNPGGAGEMPHFELSAFSLKQPSAEIEATLKTMPEPDDRSLAAYVVRRGVPEYITDLQGWKRTYAGVEFKSQTSEIFRQMRLTKLACVPLLRQGFDVPTCELLKVSDEIDGLISVHYRDEAQTPQFVRCSQRTAGTSMNAGAPTEGPDLSDSAKLDRKCTLSLEIMSRCTSAVLNQLRQSERLKTARKLTALTEEHLTNYHEDPRQVREKFLVKVIELIKQQLHAGAVTIFCRVPLEDRLVCAATTGLLAISPTAPPRYIDKVANASYGSSDPKPGGGLWQTVQVWKDGTAWHGEVSERECKFIETLDGRTPIKGNMVLYPITVRSKGGGPNPTGQSEMPEVLGVVRVGQRASPSGQEPVVPGMFDVVEIGTLRFILEQIAPILHALENRIQREDAISIVRHDLLAPSGTIRNAVDDIEAAVAGRLPKDLEYTLSNLRDSAMRLGGLYDDLKMDAPGAFQVKPQRTNLESDIVAPMKRMFFQYAAQTSRMTIRYDGFERIPLLNVDRGLIERALYNLIMNAIKYGDPGSEILVVGRQLSDGFAVDVENYGMGVDDASALRIFERYYRSPMAIARRLGVGLGLEIVRRIMKAHQGNCTLENRRNPTVFRLCFPMSRKA